MAICVARRKVLHRFLLIAATVAWVFWTNISSSRTLRWLIYYLNWEDPNYLWITFSENATTYNSSRSYQNSSHSKLLIRRSRYVSYRIVLVDTLISFLIFSIQCLVTVRARYAERYNCSSPQENLLSNFCSFSGSLFQFHVSCSYLEVDSMY